VVSCLPADRVTPVVALRPADASSHRRDRLVAHLLDTMGVRRAVFLAEPDAGSRDGELFPDLPERVHLPCDDPVGLTAKAWELLRGGGEPERTLDVAPDADFVAALFTALRAGAALRVDDDAPPVPFAEHNPDDGDEAVLVEHTGEADDLTAAVYAHHRGARLVVTPKPDLAEVHAVVAEEQDRVTAAAGAIGDAVKGIGFVEALWRYLSTGGHDPYAAVEAVVTARVPAEAVADVGEQARTHALAAPDRVEERRTQGVGVDAGSDVSPHRREVGVEPGLQARVPGAHVSAPQSSWRSSSAAWSTNHGLTDHGAVTTRFLTSSTGTHSRPDTSSGSGSRPPAMVATNTGHTSFSTTPEGSTAR
jgi:hypothetical protein